MGNNFNYVKTFFQTSGAVRTIALDATGTLWQEDVVVSPGRLNQIFNGIIAGSYMFSTTQDDVEYMCLSNLQYGTDIPRQYNPTPATGVPTFDRISQVGPGAPPTFQTTTSSSAATQATITAWSAVGGVVSFTAVNTFTAGEIITLSGFGVSTFFNGRTFAVLGTGLSGSGFQISFAGTSGGSDSGLATSQYGYNISGITQAPAASDAQDPGHFQILLWSEGPTSKTPGNILTVFYTNQAAVPNGQDPNLVVGGYVYLICPFITGTFQVTSVGGAFPPGAASPRFYFTVQMPSVNFQYFSTTDQAVGTYQVTLATMTVQQPISNVSVGDQITISGASPSGWNSTWTISALLNSGVYTITSTQLTAGVATYGWEWAGSGNPIAPLPGQIITVIGTTNGNLVFNGTDLPIATVTGGPQSGTFTVNNVSGPDVPSAAEAGQAETSGTSFQFDPGQKTVGATQNPIYGNAAANTGIVTVVGANTAIGAGTRQAVVFFETRNGFKTACSAPITFSTTEAANYILSTNVPLGPPNVIRRWIAFTVAGANGIPGPFFYTIDNPVSYTLNGQNYLYTATYIDDNVTTTAKFVFTDAVLQAGEEIDVQGNNLFSQIELGSPAWNIAYANRMFYGLEQNKVLNFNNLTFDGGYLPTANNTGSPAGAQLSPPAGGTVTGVVTTGTLGSITLVNHGLYTIPPVSLDLVGGGGSGATASFIATFTINGYVITSASLTSPGSGYTSAPAAIFSGGTPIIDATANVGFSGAAGKLGPGVYSWGVTAVDGSGGETTPQIIGTATLTAGNEAQLTWIPVTGAASYKVYRTKVNSSALLFQGAATLGQSTGYTDNTPDASLGGAAPTTNTTTGTPAIPATVSPITPLGWGVDLQSNLNLGFTGSGATLATSPTFGSAYYIPNQGTTTLTTLGMIIQGAYQDAYNVPIILPNTQYSVRVTASIPSGLTGGNLVIDLATQNTGLVSGTGVADGGYGPPYGQFILPFSQMTGTQAIFSGALLVNPFLTGVPSGLILRVYATNIVPGADVLIDRIEIYPTNAPVNTTNVRVSYADNFEAFDGVTGNLGLASERQLPVNGAFILHDQLFFLQSTAMQSTQDIPGVEPNAPGGGWSLHEVSNRVGTCGIHAYDYGEEWMVTACRNGVYGFNGGQPMRIDFQQKELWETINWSAGASIVCRNDLPNRRILVAVPLPTPNQWLPNAPVNANPTVPNVIMMWNYQGLGSFEALVSSPEIHTTMFGSLAALDMRLKFCLWQIPTPYMGFVTQPDLVTQSLEVCNAVGNSKIYRFDQNATSDDGAAINATYTSYGFVNSAKAATAPLLGMHRKRYQMLQTLVEGSGAMTVKVYPNYILNPKTLVYNPSTYTVPGGVTLQQKPPDDIVRPLNIGGNRAFVQWSVNAPGAVFKLSKCVMVGTVDPYSVVNPNAG